jgi:hypothetical protein
VAPHEYVGEQWHLLGAAPHTAEVIIAEIGSNMSVFPTAGHLGLS